MIESDGNNQYQIFTIVFPEKPTVKKIRLKGYAGLYKRIDILARAIIVIEQYATVRKDKQIMVHGVFPENDEIITVLEYRPTGTIIREKQAVLEILKALKRKETSLDIREKPVDKYLYDLSKYYDLIYLSEKGRPIKEYSRREKTAYVLGAHKDPPAMFRKALKRHRHNEVSIGPYSYLATHVIAYVLWRSQASISLDKG